MIGQWIKRYHERCTEGVEDENLKFEIIRMNHQLFGALGMVLVYLSIYLYYGIHSLTWMAILNGLSYTFLIYINQFKKTRHLSDYLFIPFSLSSVCVVDNTLGETGVVYILYYLTFIELLLSILNNRISAFISNIFFTVLFAGISLHFKHSLFLDNTIPEECITVHRYITNFIFVASLAFYVFHSMTMRKKYENSLRMEKVNRDENEKRLAQEKLILEIQKQDAEYRLLKNQLNPHFVFNTLETLRYLSKKDEQKFDEYIYSLSEFLRISLKNDESTATIQEELVMLNHYMKIQMIRFDKAIVFENAVSKKVENYRLPYFSLVTLVENAIKHNQMTLENPLEIRLYDDGENLFIENNLQLRAVHLVSTGIGLKNLGERYTHLYGSELSVTKTDKIFLVVLRLLKS